MTQAATPERPKAFPPDHRHFLLPGPAGALEVLTDRPEPQAAQPAVAVLCHPHSQHGGTMRNKVVHIMERSMRELGLCTVRFNFRGVGRSEGRFDNGDGETGDLLAVVRWTEQVLGNYDLWLGGFSFGSYVALRGAQALSIKQLVSIAPPVQKYDFAALARPSCPWLVVQGDEDDVVSPEAVFEWVEAMEDPPQLIRMKGADHFFHRRLMDLRGVLKNGVRRQLPERASA